MSNSAQIGVTGLAVMGAISPVTSPATATRSPCTTGPRPRHALVERIGREQLVATETAKEFVEALERPRRLMIMVKAGEPTDAVIQEFAPLLEPGDMIIDSGDAHFEDTRRGSATCGARASTSSARACPVARRAR